MFPIDQVAASVRLRELRSRLEIVLPLAGALMPSQAGAQTVPVWHTTDTESIVVPTAASFKDGFIYAVKVTAPYAIIITLILSVIAFFVALAHFRKH